MAVDNHNSQIKHSLHGRLFGLDHRNLGVFGGGDLRYGTETAATGTTLAPGGTSILAGAAASVFELTPPSASMIGVRKRLVNNSTGAAAQYAKLVTGNFAQAGLITNNTVQLTTRGVAVDLEYISTALVVAMAVPMTTGAAFLALFTTST